MMLEFYEGLKSLHQRLADEGSSPYVVQLQELVVFNIADWTAEEVSELCRDAAAAYCTDGAADFVSTIEPFGEITCFILAGGKVKALESSSCQLVTYCVRVA